MCSISIRKLSTSFYIRKASMNTLKKFRFDVDLNSIRILKLLANAKSKLGKFKGELNTLPNPDALLNLIRCY
jgi:hypothetical protein